MTTRESEARRLVFGQRERRRLVSLQIVTAVACIEVRRSGKLSGMPVSVTVGTALELHFEERVLPFREMALGTLQTGMAAL